MFYIITGNKVQVRCVKLLKPYLKKGVVDDDDDEDEDDEDYSGGGRAVPPEGRIMEHDVLSQAYHIGRSDHFLGHVIFFFQIKWIRLDTVLLTSKTFRGSVMQS